MSIVSARNVAMFAAGFAMIAGTAPVSASDTGPVFVVPSRPGVPIPINGRDASWSIVEGDIGLARPGHLTPVIIGGGRPLPPRWSYHGRPYYPHYGRQPARGRNEVDPGPHRPMPEPAEPYFRSWSTSSDPQYSDNHQPPRPRPQPYNLPQSYNVESEPLPATIENPPVPFAPPIVVVPRGRRP
jgi:hypothetical protein